MLINEGEFNEYMTRHRSLLHELEGTQIVAEDNQDMLGTYAMIDPQGKVYTNLKGRYHYSKQSSIDIRFSAAWAQVMDGFSQQNFINRGGEWGWKKKELSLPIHQDDDNKTAVFG